VFGDFAYALNHQLSPELIDYSIANNILLPTERVEFLIDFFAQVENANNQSVEQPFQNLVLSSIVPHDSNIIMLPENSAQLDISLSEGAEHLEQSDNISHSCLFDLNLNEQLLYNHHLITCSDKNTTIILTLIFLLRYNFFAKLFIFLVLAI
jgi:hypothetical protein